MKQQFKTILKLTIGYSLAFCLAGAIPIAYMVWENNIYMNESRFIGIGSNPGILEVNDKGELTVVGPIGPTFQFMTSSEASAIPNHVEVEAGRVTTSTGVYGTGVGMGYSRYYSKPFAMCVSDKDKVDLSDSFRFLVK
jgi:hypothetical protein